MTDWAQVKNRPDLWAQMTPQYFYVRRETVEKMATARNTWRYHARLVLEVDHPGLFRVGELSCFPDVSADALNAAVEAMAAAERRRAFAVFGMLRSHPEALGERLKPLREEALRIYSRMERANEAEMQSLNALFNDLTDGEQRLRFAYSVQNPWMLNFIQLRGPVSHAFAIAALDHIRVIAVVTDKAWLSAPVYPFAGRYSRGMRGAIGIAAPGDSAKRAKRGEKKMIYAEPALSITDIIPVPRFYQYRDCLPEAWLNPQTPREKAAAEAAGKEAAAWMAEHQGETPVPFSRKRRPNGR